MQGDNAAASWMQYKQQVNVYLTASDLQAATDKRKVAILLHCMGPEYLKTFNTFVWDAVGDIDIFASVIGRWDAYFEPKKHLGTCRNKFLTRIQKTGESLKDYVTDLKHLGDYCEFGALKDALISDKIAAGVGDVRLKEKLLSKDRLTLTQTEEILVQDPGGRFLFSVGHPCYIWFEVIF